MDSAVLEQLILDEDEQRLLVQLLESEQSEIAGEIHHTRTAGFRDQLRERREAVGRLLAKIKIRCE